MKKITGALLLGLIAFAGGNLPSANAGLLVFNKEADFVGALAGLDVHKQDFESFWNWQQFPNNHNYDGVTIHVPNSNDEMRTLDIIHDPSLNWWNGSGFIALDPRANGHTNEVEFSFDQPMNAFGLHIVAEHLLYGVQLFADPGLWMNSLGPIDSNHQRSIFFMGMVSDIPFTSIALQSRWQYILAIDNIYWGRTPPSSPSSVPEPNTMLLFGFGIAGLAAATRKRRKDSVRVPD